MEQIPNRDDVSVGETWDLALLYPTDEAWEKDFKKYESLYSEISKFKGTLNTSSEALLACLEFAKSLNLLLERLGHYASLRVSEDSSNDKHLNRQARLNAIETCASEAAAFLNPELQAIPDNRFEELMNSSILKSWKNYLQKIRRFKLHVLSEKEERLLALAGESLYGHGETFSQLTNVDMKFGSLMDESGKQKPLSQSSYSSFLISQNPEVREKAFKQFYSEFSDHQFSLASMLASSVKNDVFQARARNYPSALESALFQDDVPVSVYNNLITTVHAHLEPLHEYYELRRQKLNLKEIYSYDTHVPLVSSIKTDTSFEKAVDLVLAALEPLDKEYVEVLKQGLLRSRWCDRYETKGKRSGAFSSSSYGNPPYILMNYKRDVFSDVYTLAHEAGHSMHTWFSQKHQSFQDYHYSIFVAEVASTFNEELLTHYLLKNTDDPKMRAYIINRQIDDIRNTLYRQTMFAEFEKQIHALYEAGEALTLQSFCDLYRKLLDAYFGKKVVLDDQLSLECLRIPHFYSAFYVYKYATGISAAISLARQVLAGEKNAKESYLNFLGLGGSVMPLAALKVAGVDLAKSTPIENALQLFKIRVKELEALL